MTTQPSVAVIIMMNDTVSHSTRRSFHWMRLRDRAYVRACVRTWTFSYDDACVAICVRSHVRAWTSCLRVRVRACVAVFRAFSRACVAILRAFSRACLDVFIRVSVRAHLLACVLERLHTC